MKKIISIIAAIFVSCSMFASELDGSYANKNIVMSFVGDSLYIDEVGIEGDVYEFKCKDNVVTARNSLDNIYFKIVRKTKNAIYITYDNKKIYKFVKVFNYDIKNMKFVYDTKRI